MSKQKLRPGDGQTLQLFDTVKIRSDAYPEETLEDVLMNNNYFVVKKYVVDLGGDDVSFVDILKIDPEEEAAIDLNNQAWQYLMAMPRWTEPFILSFPEQSIIRV